MQCNHSHDSSRRRRRSRYAVLLAGAVMGGVALFLRVRSEFPIGALPPAPGVSSAVPLPAVNGASSTGTPRSRIVVGGQDYSACIAELEGRGWSAAEVRRHVREKLRIHFHHEHYRAELAFGQLHYPLHPWEPAPEIETLLAVEQVRLADVQKLGRELNEILEALFGPEFERVAPFPSLFGLDAPAPKLDSLSPGAREDLEHALMTADPAAQMSSVERLALAEQILTPADFALYAKWNSPTATVLRAQLVEFAPTSAEYAAIYRWQEIAGSENGFADDVARTEARARLQSALGAERAAAFQRTEDPDYQTGLRDLRQLGLPLNRLHDVLSLRRAAADTIAAISNDSTAPEAKTAAVEHARQTYRQRLADLFRVPVELIPEELM